MNTLETNQQPPAAQPLAAPPLQQPAPVPPAAPAPAPAVTVRRSPGLAVVLSCFPGLGHLYLGLYNRAFAIFGSFALCIWISEHAGNVGILIPFVVLFGFVDAYRQAQAINLGLAPEPIIGSQAKQPAARRGRLGFGVFLLLIGALLLYNQFYPIDFSFLQDWWPLILVAAGVYMVAVHFVEKQRQAKRETEFALPPVDTDRHA
ncbi:MAG TPA: DUF5668 domain-containing protein [Thermoanaerobaculaceae bacterium]|nr:DUF5668 domain-containing protein [Thermoanaerobaculaceae bacterium]